MLNSVIHNADYVEFYIFALFKFNLIFIFMKQVIFIVEFVFQGRELLSPCFFYSRSEAEDYAEDCKKENSKILTFNVLHFVRL